MKIGFIGLGNMASAMIGGILKKNLYSPEDLIGADKSEEAVKRAAETFHIHTTTDNIEVAEAADVLILAVKPQFFEGMIAEIKGAVGEDKLVISIAPGKTMEWLMDHFGKEMKLVRCMPNTPALVGEGCTGFCTYSMVTEEEQETARKILESFGKAYPVPENLMDTVVGVSGSSPAYVFMFIEALADAAVRCGMPRSQAYTYAAQTVYGSAGMVLESGKHPAVLKDMVCSPAGTTIEGVAALEKNNFRNAVIEAVTAACERSTALGK